MWADIGHWLLTHLQSILTGVGLTGSGIGVLIMVRHCPTPSARHTFKCFLFDCAQDLAKNNDRIGERLDDDGKLFFVEPPVRRPQNGQ